jgi:hypothetical protein
MTAGNPAAMAEQVRRVPHRHPLREEARRARMAQRVEGKRWEALGLTILALTIGNAKAFAIMLTTCRRLHDGFQLVVMNVERRHYERPTIREHE